MALTPDLIDDFVTATLKRFRRHKWTDLSLEYPDYVCSRILKRHSKNEDGGSQIDWKIKVKNSGNARMTGMFAQDKTNIEDVLISAQIPWRFQTTNFSYSIYEDEFQSDDYTTIVKLLKVREHDALSDMVELQEEQLWTAPDSPTHNHMHGIPYWVVKNPGTAGNLQSGDYVGGNPAGHPGGVAGVDSAQYARWRNWAFGWKDISQDDFVLKFKRAIRYTRFKAPVPHPNTDMGANKYEAFSTLAVVEGLEALAESRNDNLGKDVAKYMGQVTVGGVPVEHVFHLTDLDNTNPVYGLNWAKFRPIAKKGTQMRRHKPMRAPNQHDTRNVHIDNASNYHSVDRRSTFAGSQVSG